MLYFEIILNKVGFVLIVPTLYFSFLLCQIPDERIIAEWEPAMGTMIRWPLGIPSDLVVELASENIIYVLVETNNQQNQAQNNFINWGIDMNNVVFISTDTYSHWTRDHGPQFLIGNDGFKVINQQFNGYPVESGCDYVELECDEEMILFDCIGTEFCNNQPEYASEGYDCYVNNDLCEDFNDDGQIMDWLGDGYCDDGNWGLDFMCNEYSFDCGDCEGAITDDNGYCNEALIVGAREYGDGRPLPSEHRGWNEDDDTNLDFANQMNWEIKNLPLYWTGGNFMTDGYGMGFSTQLMVNENNMSNEDFTSMVNQYLNINDYHILENPNVESIQHIDCLAKLVDSETIIIKQVAESSPEYDCIEEFAESFLELNTFYDRPFEIHRILCPEISGGPWETNDPDTNRIWWRDGGVHQNITHATNPAPISGAHCWLQKVSISKPKPDEKYGDIFVDTNKSFEHFKKWNNWAKERETHPDSLRRPLWLNRPLGPQKNQFYIDKS